jgi:aryl-alcohol dehydrogenase-like predicted oxidoreductase
MVPRIGLGTMGLSISYGKPLPDEQRLAVLDHAHKMGETFWDTSDFYVRSSLYTLSMQHLTCVSRAMLKTSSANGSLELARETTFFLRPNSAAPT